VRGACRKTNAKALITRCHTPLFRSQVRLMSME
jgi:hypothetical protein